MSLFPSLSVRRAVVEVPMLLNLDCSSSRARIAGGVWKRLARRWRQRRLKITWISQLARDAFLRRRIPFGTRTLLSILDVRKYENTVSQDLVSEGSLHATTHAFGRMPKSNAPSGFQRQRSIRFARPPRKSDVSQPRLSGKRRAGSRRQRGG